MIVFRLIFLRIRNVLDKFVEKIKTHILYSVTFFFPENRAVCEIMRNLWYNQTGLTGQRKNAYFFFTWHNSPQWARASSLTRFLDHTQQRTTVGRTLLVEWLSRRRDLYLTIHNSHNRQTSMPPGGIRTHNFSRGAVSALRLTPRGHWDRQWCI